VNEKEAGFLFFAGTLISHGHAEDLQTNNELNKVESDINEVKQDMQRLSLQKDTLQDLLADIEKRYGETAASLKNCKLKLSKNAKVWTRFGWICWVIRVK